MQISFFHFNRDPLMFLLPIEDPGCIDVFYVYKTHEDLHHPLQVILFIQYSASTQLVLCHLVAWL